MNDQPDPTREAKLTAYALGELDPADRAEVESWIKNDPAARRTVEELHEFSAALTGALAEEAKGLAVAAPSTRTASAQNDQTIRTVGGPGRIVRFPYFLVAGAAAACFAAYVALRPPGPPAQTTQIVVRSSPAPAGPLQSEVQLTSPDAEALQPAGAVRQSPPVESTPAEAPRTIRTASAAYQPSPEFFSVHNSPAALSSERDASSYADVRRFLVEGKRPPRETVRVAGLVNYFQYRYAPPRDGSLLAASMEVSEAPWNPAHRLVRIGLKGREVMEGVEPIIEGRSVFVDEAMKSIVAVAKDVKLQVAFNSETVEAYRLIGYETHYTRTEPSYAKNADPEDDGRDVGHLTAGATYTALYEVVPVSPEKARPVVAAAAPDRLKFSISSREPATAGAPPAPRPELARLKVRYKAPAVETTADLEYTLVDTGATFAAASQEFKFAAAVAGFGLMLRENPAKTAVSYDSVLAWAQDGRGSDRTGDRDEFIELVKKAKSAEAAPAPRGP